MALGRSIPNVGAVLLDNVDAAYRLTTHRIEQGYQRIGALCSEGPLQAIRERNLTVPANIAMVTFDETTRAILVHPSITLIAQPTYEIDKTVAELLLQCMTNPPAR